MCLHGQFLTLLGLHLGESVTRESGGTIRVFPYDEQDPTGPPRTHEESMEQAKKAAETGKAVSKVSLCNLYMS